MESLVALFPINGSDNQTSPLIIIRLKKIDTAHYFFVELSKPFIEVLSLTPGRYPSRGSVPPSEEQNMFKYD